MDKLIKLSDGELMSVLWNLCYNEKATLEELELTNNSGKEVIEYILADAEKNSRDLKIGKAEPVLDTQGIDLGIKNRIVRDVVLCYVYRAVYDSDRNVIKAAKLLKTQDDGTSYSSRRIFGGLLEIGFSKEETEYVKQTCDTYPIGLLIERLITNKQQKEDYYEVLEFVTNNTPIDSEVDEPEIPESGLEVTTVELVNTPDNPFKKMELILANADILEEFVWYIAENEMYTEESIIDKIDSLEKELKILRSGLECVENLSGIDLDYVLAKKDVLLDLFKLKEML